MMIDALLGRQVSESRLNYVQLALEIIIFESQKQNKKDKSNQSLFEVIFTFLD